MVKTNLFSIFRKFDQKEIKEFSEFVRSPFFNKNVNIIKLFEYIKKQYPDFKEEKLEKKYIYKKLFSKGAYNDGFMRTIIFNLNKLAEEYLTYKSLTRDPVRKSIYFLSELNERKLDKIFLKYYKDIEKDVNSTQYKTQDYFYNKYLSEDIMHHYANWSRFKAKHLKDYEENLMLDKIKNLSTSFLLGVLSDYRILLWKMEFDNIEVSIDFVDKLVAILKENEDFFNEIPGIKLHLYEILLIKEGEKRYFDELKQMLINETETLTHDQRYSLHNALQNFSARQIFAGEEQYKKERFELFKIALKHDLYKGSEDIYFDDILFGMIAFNGIIIKEYEWTEKFIEDYKHLLAPENANVVVNVSLARLYLMKKDFKKALACLNAIKSIKHIQYKYPVKDLTLMVFYELAMFSQAYYQLDTYRHWINKYKENFSQDRIERIINFTKCYSRLLKLKEQFDLENFEKLKSDVQNDSNILNRDWLLEKIYELKN